MYHEYTQEQLRQYCRKNIESLEGWARRLIHEKMVVAYGENFANKQINNENYLINAKVRKHIQEKMEKEPLRFPRAVDTLFIDQIIYFLCHPVWYNDLFKPALDYIYPQGKDEAREYLNRLVPIRNPLSHSNPITMHDVERAICYSHDFIEGIKKYYKDRGEEQVWNVPRIIKVKDSLGNVFYNPNDENNLGSIFAVKNELRCGDTYSVEIEVDPSYSKNEYEIIWERGFIEKKEFRNSEKYVITFGVADVTKLHSISCKIVQKKEWHKYTFHDCIIHVHLTVLPPLE